MSLTPTLLTPALYDYLIHFSLREHWALQELRAATLKLLPNAAMALAPEQGQLLGLLAKLIQAKKTLDIGTFTGYSALSVALAIPNGQVITCDCDARAPALATTFWEKAEVSHKIEFRLAPALEVLDELLNTAPESFDFIFIDADKQNNKNYYEKSLSLLRPGGLVVIDNVLWHGRVVDPKEKDKQTEAIRSFNEFLFQDQRVDMSMLPLGDGMTIARKKS